MGYLVQKVRSRPRGLGDDSQDTTGGTSATVARAAAVVVEGLPSSGLQLPQTQTLGNILTTAIGVYDVLDANRDEFVHPGSDLFDFTDQDALRVLDLQMPILKAFRGALASGANPGDISTAKTALSTALRAEADFLDKLPDSAFTGAMKDVGNFLISLPGKAVEVAQAVASGAGEAFSLVKTLTVAAIAIGGLWAVSKITENTPRGRSAAGRRRPRRNPTRRSRRNRNRRRAR